MTQPLGRFSKLIYSATSTVTTSNDTFAGSSLTDLSNVAFFGTDTRLAVEYLTVENRSRGYVILCHTRYMAAGEDLVHMYV